MCGTFDHSILDRTKERGCQTPMETLVNSVWPLFLKLWPHILATTLITVNVAASLHALLTKRDTRSTIAWVGLVWLSPGFGAAAYALFGVNRIRRKATRLWAGRRAVVHRVEAAMPSSQRITDAIGPTNALLRSLTTLVQEVTKRPLLDGNTIEPLHGGDEAYPRMLAAIESAKHSIGMTSYIFDNDPTGKLFIDALCRAVDRGVAVRVLIDGIGSRYSFPTSVALLRKKGVTVSRFMPTTVPFYLPYANLRNHRKILVVDGQHGFTGGLNIRHGCWLSKHPSHPVQDMHFALTGPIVTQLLEVFIEDWAFASGESLGALRDGDPNLTWQPNLEFTGTSLARGIRYGPDDREIGRIKLILIAALASARRSVKIMTPYFLPDDAICQALGVAALRGVQVDIVLPQQNNLALVGWASEALLWQVLSRGCNIWMSLPPFDHTKLMVVDSSWTLFGSGNWDERSMRLNFEFNVESYDAAMAEKLDAHIGEIIGRSTQRTLSDVDSRSLLTRVRDGIARLFAPYL
mgnify:FL=1